MASLEIIGLELLPFGTLAAGRWHVQLYSRDGWAGSRELRTRARSGHAALGEAAAIAREHGLILQTVTTERHGEVACGA